MQNGHHAGDRARVAEADPDSWKHIFDVSFFGAMHLIQAAAPVMREPGSIVLINSGSAPRNPPTMASLVRTSALEPGPRIRVNGGQWVT